VSGCSVGSSTRSGSDCLPSSASASTLAVFC